jgi:Flp pilus assembly protein TadG
MSSQRQSVRERGAALVEFALVLPLVLMLTFGMVSSALAYNHKLDLVHAAREGARYGATLPRDQCVGTPNPCGTSTWAQVVRSVVVQRSLGDVASADVCVALVSGNPGTTSSGFFVGSTRGDNLCFDDGNGDSGDRVQIAVKRTTDKINGILFSFPVTLTSQATAKFEQ